ncbi:MAG: ABC transporter permease [Bacillota bacterium]|nr:ABC transporter permease [Bacillota bacterium]
MFEFRLAVKNLWRHKRRTLLTVVVIAFGVMLHATTDSLLAGFEEDSFRAMVRYETGEVILTAAGYWADRKELPKGPAIPEAGQVAARVRRMTGVRGATPQLVFAAALNNGVEELPVKAIGADPRTDGDVLGLHQVVKAGRYLRPGRNEALLGQDLTDLMDLKVGDTFTLVLRTKASAFEATDLTVAGLLKSPDPAVNDGTVYLPLDVAQGATGLGTAATHILVAGQAGYRNVRPLREELRQGLSGLGPALDLHTWEDAAADLLAVSRSKRSFFSVTLGLIAVLAGLGVANSILLAGIERTREVGTLKALGLTEGQVTRLFMLEGLGLGLFGGLLGALAATGTVAYLALVGLDYSMFSGYNLGLPIELAFRGAWNFPTILSAWATSAVFAFLVSYVPARRAARLDPAAALHD